MLIKVEFFNFDITRDLRFRIFIGLRHSDKRGCKIRRVLSVTSARYQCCVYVKLLSGLKGPRMLFRVTDLLPNRRQTIIIIINTVSIVYFPSAIEGSLNDIVKTTIPKQTSTNHDKAHPILHTEGILPKGPYLPCVSMAGRALLAGIPSMSLGKHEQQCVLISNRDQNPISFAGDKFVFGASV